MVWTSATDNVLHLRKLRDRVVDEFAELRVDVAEIRDILLNVRSIALAVRAELVAARGVNDTVADRLAAIETRLVALEPPPEPPTP